MPNWCNNVATFSGEKENLDNLFNAIRAAIRKEEETREGQKIHSSEIKEGYFFDMYFDGDTLYYETRWSPNVEDVAELCKEFSVSADVEFSEPGCQIHGVGYCYEDGTYMTEYVNQRFLEKIEYDMDKNVYLYNENEYESEDLIIETHYKTWKEKNLF